MIAVVAVVIATSVVVVADVIVDAVAVVRFWVRLGGGMMMLLLMVMVVIVVVMMLMMIVIVTVMSVGRSRVATRGHFTACLKIEMKRIEKRNLKNKNKN